MDDQVVGAARARFVSEASLYQQLKALERELRGQLFVQGDGRLEVTQLGRSIFEPATLCCNKRVIQASGATGQDVSGPKLRVGALPAAIRFCCERCASLRALARRLALRCTRTELPPSSRLSTPAIWTMASWQAEPSTAGRRSGTAAPTCEQASAVRVKSCRSGRRRGCSHHAPQGVRVAHVPEEYARFLGCKVIVHYASAESALRFVASGVASQSLSQQVGGRWWEVTHEAAATGTGITQPGLQCLAVKPIAQSRRGIGSGNAGPAGWGERRCPVRAPLWEPLIVQTRLRTRVEQPVLAGGESRAAIAGPGMKPMSETWHEGGSQIRLLLDDSDLHYT